MSSEKKWMLIGALIAALVVIAVAYYIGNQAGMAAGAATAAGAASQFWRARGRDEQSISDAGDAATDAIERVESSRVDAEAELDKSRAEVSSLTGEEKANLVDSLTDPETET